jgi:hypothetical protein
LNETNPRYERAFLDLFEDDLVDQGYDWKAVLQKFLFTGEQPLISSITAGCKTPSTSTHKLD